MERPRLIRQIPTQLGPMLLYLDWNQSQSCTSFRLGVRNRSRPWPDSTIETILREKVHELAMEWPSYIKGMTDTSLIVGVMPTQKQLGELDWRSQ